MPTKGEITDARHCYSTGMQGSGRRARRAFDSVGHGVPRALGREAKPGPGARRVLHRQDGHGGGRARVRSAVHDLAPVVDLLQLRAAPGGDDVPRVGREGGAGVSA